MLFMICFLKCTFCRFGIHRGCPGTASQNIPITPNEIHVRPQSLPAPPLTCSGSHTSSSGCRSVQSGHCTCAGMWKTIAGPYRRLSSDPQASHVKWGRICLSPTHTSTSMLVIVPNTSLMFVILNSCLVFRKQRLPYSPDEPQITAVPSLPPKCWGYTSGNTS